MGKKFGFSFSWKRALRISAAKGRLSRQLGVPLTRSDRQRRVGRQLGCVVLLAISLGSVLFASVAVAGRRRLQRTSTPFALRYTSSNRVPPLDPFSTPTIRRSSFVPAISSVVPVEMSRSLQESPDAVEPPPGHVSGSPYRPIALR